MTMPAIPERTPLGCSESEVTAILCRMSLGRRSGQVGLANHFGSLELAILEVMWTADELDVTECARRLDSGQAYTTVKTVMERLVRKGWLGRSKVARSYMYWATETRAEVGAKLAEQQTKHLLDGFGDLAVTNFIKSVQGDPARLSHIRKLLAAIADDEQPHELSDSS